MELQIRELTKKYGSKTALNHVDLSFSPGIYGLLGPNGSGKSTMMNLITGNLTPSSGQVLWKGKPIGEWGKNYRSVIGYVPQQQALYADFTVERFLDYMAALKGIPTRQARERQRQLLEEVDLTEQAGYQIHMLSGGMKQRLLIAQAMLGEPMILIMDEPTVGLDPTQRAQIRDMIAKFSTGKIVLIASHIVSDLERLSDAVILLKKGTVIRKGPVDTLIGDVQKEAAAREIASLEDVYLHDFGE